MQISSDDEGLRLDKFIRRMLPRMPLNLIFQNIRKGNIKVNGKKAKQDCRLKGGDDIYFSFAVEEYLESKKPRKFKQRFTVVYEDKDLLVADKPAGLASHGGTGIEDSLIAEVRTYLKDTEGRSSLAHRLDRETSGIVLIGKNKTFLRMLNKELQERTVNKTYLALVAGKFSKKQGTIVSSLKRVQEEFTTKIIIDPEGKEARLSYHVLKEFPLFSLIEITLHTGRMHQIRAQLASEGHPVLGDKIYSNLELNKKLKTERLYLHAYKIAFTHPRTGKYLKLVAPIPKEFMQFQQKFKA